MKITFNEAVCVVIGAMSTSLVAIGFSMTSSCNRRPENVPPPVIYPEPEIVGAASSYDPCPLRVWKVNVGGCQYVVFRSGNSNAGESAVHAGNCTNQIHKTAQPINFYIPSTVPPGGFLSYTGATNIFVITNSPMNLEKVILNY